MHLIEHWLALVANHLQCAKLVKVTHQIPSPTSRTDNGDFRVRAIVHVYYREILRHIVHCRCERCPLTLIDRSSVESINFTKRIYLPTRPLFGNNSTQLSDKTMYIFTLHLSRELLKPGAHLFEIYSLPYHNPYFLVDGWLHPFSFQP